MPKFFRISCSCPGKKNRRGRSNYKGAIQIDVPNITHHHCKNCKTTWEHKVNEDGIITRRIIKEKIEYLENVVVVDVS